MATGSCFFVLRIPASHRKAFKVIDDGSHMYIGHLVFGIAVVRRVGVRIDIVI
jgi:hypothetical protein